MPRTWSNVKYIETLSAAQKLKRRPPRLTPFALLLVLSLLLFGGLLAYTMSVVTRHPVTEIPNLMHPPKDE